MCCECGATTFNIMTFSIKTLKNNDTHHNGPICDSQHKWPSAYPYWVPLCLVSCWVSRLFKCYAECQYAECHYAECCYAECHGVVNMALATKIHHKTASCHFLSPVKSTARFEVSNLGLWVNYSTTVLLPLHFIMKYLDTIR